MKIPHVLHIVPNIMKWNVSPLLLKKTATPPTRTATRINPRRIGTMTWSCWDQCILKHFLCWNPRTFTVGASNTERLVSSFTNFDSTDSQHTDNNVFSFLVKSNLVKLETRRTVILPLMVIVPCCNWHCLIVRLIFWFNFRP